MDGQALCSKRVAAVNAVASHVAQRKQAFNLARSARVWSGGTHDDGCGRAAKQ